MLKMEKMICSKCNKPIILEKDEWYENNLFRQGTWDSVVYFHRECYKNFHKDKFKEEYQKKVKKLTPMIKNILGGKIET